MGDRSWLFIGLAVVLHGAFLEAARRAPATNLLSTRLGNQEAPLTWLDVVGPDAEQAAPKPNALVTTQPAPSPEAAPKPTTEPAAQTERVTARPAAATTRDAAALSESESEAQAEADAEAEAEAAAAAQEAAGEPSAGLQPGPATPLDGPGENGWSEPELAANPLDPSGLLNLAAAVALNEAAAAPAAPTEIKAPTSSPQKAASESVQSTLIGSDKKVGIDLPATQVVVGAVATATRALPVGHNTRASFEVKLDGSGKVTSVRVLKASGGDAATWSGAAKAAAASLNGKQLGLGGAKGVGATVTVDVKVRHVFPSGSAKGADVKPVCANQIINDIAEAASSGKTKDAGETAKVPLFTDENGRPCIPVGVNVVSDETNIGATKQIQVQTSSRVTVNGRGALPAELQAVNKDPFWVKSSSDAPRAVAPFRVRKFQREREKKK